MNADAILDLIFHVIGGLGIFLLGMRNLSDGLQTIAGEKLRKLIGMATNNRFMATGVGTLVTCVIQSSSVTTVMVVGFVNAGLMTLRQAIGVIMGANIGTTMTGWILAIKIDQYGLPLLGLAVLVYLFSKNEKVRYTAMAVMGLGMVFAGLELMKDGFAPIRDVPEFLAWFQKFPADTYFGVLKCALVGCVLTLIVQSSSATLGITMGLAASGIIHFETAAALVLGENIGTTITAFLASLGTTTNGKRAAYAHITFNVLGVLWITAIFSVYIGIIRKFIGHDPNTVVMVGGVQTYPYIQAGIAAVHSGFNIANTLLFLPFMGVLAAALIKFVPDLDKPTHALPQYTKLNKLILDSPMVGIAQSRKEIIFMGQVDREMFDMFKDIVSVKEVNEDSVKKLFEKEERLDGMQMEITSFLTKLLSGVGSAGAGVIPRSLSEEAQKQIRLADEFETISDYLTAQLKLYLRIRNAGVTVPDIMLEELLSLHNAVVEYFEQVNRAYGARDILMVAGANVQASEITKKVRDLRGRHLARLAEIPVDPLLSTTYPDMLVGYRRIKEHILNIAEVMVGKGGYAGNLPHG